MLSAMTWHGCCYRLAALRSCVILLTTSLLIVGCGGEGDELSGHTASSGTGGGAGGGGGGGPVVEPKTFGACDGMAAGPRASGELVVGLSRAHASYRFF